MLRAWYLKINKALGILFNYPVSAFATQTAFFLIISAFPFVMLLITLIGYIPGLEAHMLQIQVNQMLPELFNGFISKIFNEIYASRNPTVISVAAGSTLLAASKGFISLIRGMNMIYGIKEKRNYFAVRGMAVLCTVTMMVAIVFTLILLVFGDKIMEVITRYFPALAKTAIVIISFRVIVIFVLLTTLFLIVYLAVPNRRSTIRAELPGAVLSAVGWIVFSFLYALYLNRVNTYVYGSLTAAVFIMLWMYFCIYIVFVGGEINCYLRLKKLQFLDE